MSRGKTRGAAATELLCNKCREILPVSDFSWCSTAQSYRPYCKACRREYSKYYHKSKKYGITMEQYTEILTQQDGRCAICGTEFRYTTTKTQPHVDHDHETDTVRGILCHGCNVSLGLMKERISTLENAIIYLRRHGKEA